jgi:hypothetical protein
MCRSIQSLHNYQPPTSEDEVRAAALQFVRKISGMSRPAKVNQVAFDRAVEAVAATTRELLSALVALSPPHDRDVERERARVRRQQQRRLEPE